MMLFKKRHPPVGSRPGTLVIPRDAAKPVISIIGYNQSGVDRVPDASIAEIPAVIQSHAVTWVDVQGIGDESLLREIGDLFGVHPLALEDVVNIPQRPKSELYENQYLYITRMSMLRSGTADLDTEQVSIFLGSNYVLTIQERCGDVFDPVRARIDAGVGPIRKSGADYLAYALIDTIIDGYYPVLEQLGELLEDLEEKTLERAGKETLREIYHAKRQVLAIRRAVWPQRDAVNAMIREESPLVSPKVRTYLRDCYDHTIQLVDVTETFRELCGNLLDLHLSSVSARTNEVMKVLTIMSSIFIPLTFLAGVYGMNFRVMPELNYPWAYGALLSVMAVLAAGMLVLFWRIGWIGARELHARDGESDAG